MNASDGRISWSPPPVGGRTLAFPVLHRSFCVATYGPMTINLWRGAPRRARIERTIEVARAQCEAHPEGGGFTLLIEAETGLPDLDARSLVSDALQEMARFIHCAAVVIEAKGFLAATARSVVNLLFAAARAPIPVRVFASIGEAARWQSALLRVEPHVEARELAQILTTVRRHHDAYRREIERR